MYDDIDDDYNKPIKIYGAFNDSYIECNSDGDKDKRLSIEEYLNMIRPYLSNMIDDHMDKWKIQLSMKISFISSRDSNETRFLYTNSDNIVIMIAYETD